MAPELFTKLPNEGGLWVPATRYPVQGVTKGALDFIGVTVSYSQVYGSKPAWKDLEEVLAPYSLERIVDIICRISSCLYGKTLPWDRETQSRICLGLFGSDEAQRIFQAVARESQAIKESERGTAPLLLFHEQQLLTLLKASFLMKNLKIEDSKVSPIGIGKALLIVSDLIDGEPGDLESIEPDQPDYSERWLRYVLANQLFSTPTVGGHALARSYDLYMTDKEILRNCGSYVDLRLLLKSITQLEPEALWSAILALASHWATISAERISEGVMAVSRLDYFSKEFKFTNEEISDFYRICVADVADLKTQIENRYTPSSLRPFDVLPIARCPIVDFSGRLYATSATLLMQKLTTGLHYLFLDESNPSSQRQKYLTYMGEVFGDYVHRALLRMFPLLTGRYIRLDDLRANIPGKYCDGLIAYEEAVLLIEAKSSLFPLDARAGYDIVAIRGRLADIYLDAAEQLQSTINALRNGLRDGNNIIPKRIKRYYPLIVTLENIPMNPIIYGEIQRILAPNGYLAASDIERLQSLDIGALERIEAVLASGTSMKELIDDKLSRPLEAEDSWGNYLYRRTSKYGIRTNEYLDERVKILLESARQFFIERKR